MKCRDKVSVAILGTGMAGCGAVNLPSGERLKPAVFDKATYFGGHTASFSHDEGYTFDEGGHVSFTKNERLKELFARNVGGEFEVVHAYINNYWRGHWIKHPTQCNLYGLPADLVAGITLRLRRRCIREGRGGRSHPSTSPGTVCRGWELNGRS